MNAEFEGKVAVVTGGTRGIGRAIADVLAAGGANVLVTGTSKVEPENLSTVYSYHPLVCDCPESLKVFAEYLSALDSLDIFVNNAGVNIINDTEDISIQEFDKVYATNTRAPFILTKAAISRMEVRGGKVLNIASIWSKITKKGRVSYICSKSGLDGLTRGLATDLAAKNILVNTLSPGFVDTDLTRTTMSNSQIEQLLETVPMRRLAKPSEIAKVAGFLCSDSNSYLTGQNIVVDGGFTNV
jgi:3-oxoacyl-[acyl-carrier protein] reductase